MPILLRDVSHVLLVPIEHPEHDGVIPAWTIVPDDCRLEVMAEGDHADAFPWAVSAKVDGRNIMAPWHRVHLIVGNPPAPAPEAGRACRFGDDLLFYVPLQDGELPPFITMRDADKLPRAPFPNVAMAEGCPTYEWGERGRRWRLVAVPPLQAGDC